MMSTGNISTLPKYFASDSKYNTIIAEFVHWFRDLRIYVTSQALFNRLSSWYGVYRASKSVGESPNPCETRLCHLIDAVVFLVLIQFVHLLNVHCLGVLCLSFPLVKEKIHHGSDYPRIKVESCWQSAI